MPGEHGVEPAQVIVADRHQPAAAKANRRALPEFDVKRQALVVLARLTGCLAATRLGRGRCPQNRRGYHRDGRAFVTVQRAVP